MTQEDDELDPAVERFVWSPGDVQVFLPWKYGDPDPDGPPPRRVADSGAKD